MTTTFDKSMLAGKSDDELAAIVLGIHPTQLHTVSSGIRKDGGYGLLEIARMIATDWHERAHSTFLAKKLTSAVERVEAGEQVKICVSLPPGSGKSTLCSLALPLYLFTKHPEWLLGLISAEQNLANKWSRDSRRFIQEGVVPVHLNPDTQMIQEWETAEHGSLIARGMNGSIVGKRLHVAIVDDPTKSFADAHSKAHREQLWDLWTGTLQGRLNTAGSLVLVVMTRWHEDDMIGQLTTKDEGWEIVNIPAIAEAQDQLGRPEGAPLLSPQRAETPEEAIERWAIRKRGVGSLVWEGQYQQHPSPPGGQVFNPEWWLRHTSSSLPPDNVGEWWSSWDLVFGTEDPETGDYAVGTVWQFHEGIAYLRDLVRGRWEFPDQIREIEGLATKWPQVTGHLIEDAATARAAVSLLKRTIPGMILVPPEGSKEVRAIACAPLVESGNVSLPERTEAGVEVAPWVEDLLVELTRFPKGTNDDQVDSVTQALNRWQKPHTASISVLTVNDDGGLDGSGGLAAALRGGY